MLPILSDTERTRGQTPVLFTPLQLSICQPALTPKMLNSIIDGASSPQSNGFSKAIYRVGGRNMIDIISFFEILRKEQISAGEAET